MKHETMDDFSGLAEFALDGWTGVRGWTHHH
jgi:hypothetical protein